MKLVDTSSPELFIAQLSEAAKAKLTAEEGEQFEQFVAQFFVGVFIEEYEGRKLSDVIGGIVSLWRFIGQLEAGSFKVAVGNPNLDEHGWQSPHTVLAILLKNMPFVVDSVRMVLNENNFKIHGIQHSILYNNRQADGHLAGFVNKEDNGHSGEALMYVEVDRHSDEGELASLKSSLESVLTDISVTVADYPAMLQRCQNLSKELQQQAQAEANNSRQQELSQSAAFLMWLAENSFTFLGYSEYSMVGKGAKQALEMVPDSALGLIKHDRESSRNILIKPLPEMARQQTLGPNLLIFAKSSRRSRVHRPAYPDYIAIKQFNKQGEVIGEWRFLGLFTARVFNQSPLNIPLLAEKVAQVTALSEFDASDHSGKELLQLLAVYPRDVLFQVEAEELYQIVLRTMHCQERQKICLFLRHDAFGRFLTVLVYVPREIYNTSLRLKIQQLLLAQTQGLDIEFNTYVSESPMARTLFNIKIDPANTPKLDARRLEQAVIQIASSWTDDFEESLLENYGEEQGSFYINRYRQAFSSGYIDAFSPARAALDVAHLERVVQGQGLSMSFYRGLNEADSTLHFKLFHGEAPLSLSDVMPILENMGFHVLGEHPYDAKTIQGQQIWIHDFSLTTLSGQALDLNEIKTNFETLFTKVWRGEAENDGFNRLIITAYMDWQEILILRSYARYMRQISVTISQEFIANTLVANVALAKALVALFVQRFDPALAEPQGNHDPDIFEQMEADFIAGLDAVPNLTEDKVLRLYLSLIKASMRSNYFQRDANAIAKPYLAIKFHPQLIPDMPKPIPRYEIFVYSARVEGVHLRGGKVARGGLRWSDRFEDYRTEVLGLVKAQAVKNSVIVPVGAKGGFVAKQLPEGDRDAYMKEGIACYQMFISGLLDITDNLVSGKVVQPDACRIHDDDDYYLVVAADKGTATFSDIANDISIERQHWLGDAFASGGSQGYDHKKMGITARGAWVSVQRHFRELGTNIQETPFTAIGIGDMAGDVFGNGMLLSAQTKLIAAFNHLHIFIDPDPDPQASFDERQRLFELPRSSWEDYCSKLISKGGGIFSRASKSIPLSEQMKKLLNTHQDALAPNELIKLLLKAKTDLLWFGGIGTYIKSLGESHADAGDKANDSLRVNGCEVNAKVIGEGGNLGMTQLGRIEYARQGGRLNTDFIDNAAGVDCSDHEVNIKILLNDLVQAGELTERQRNKLLTSMTDEVGEHVLNNNYRQTQAISIAHQEGARRIEEYRRLINSMEASAKLDRQIEFIPSDEQITERKNAAEGLTRPELAVLISYVKGELKEALNSPSFSANEALASEVENLFPEAIKERFPDAIQHHRLRAEIIATQIANDMVNHMGITFVERLRQSTGATTESIALAYVIARDVFGLEACWQEVEQLDYTLASDQQMRLMSKLMSLVRRACRWLIRNRRSELNVIQNMARFTEGVAQIAATLPRYLGGQEHSDWKKHYKHATELGLSEATAITLAGSDFLYASLGIIEAQQESGHDLEVVTSTYYELGTRLDLNWFSGQITDLKPANHWQALARETFREDLDWQQRSLTVGLLTPSVSDDIEATQIDQLLAQWLREHEDLLSRWRSTLSELRASGEVEFSMYSVALRELLDLAQSTIHAAEKPAGV